MTPYLKHYSTRMAQIFRAGLRTCAGEPACAESPARSSAVGRADRCSDRRRRRVSRAARGQPRFAGNLFAQAKAFRAARTLAALAKRGALRGSSDGGLYDGLAQTRVDWSQYCATNAQYCGSRTRLRRDVLAMFRD
jgi:hypothetical protein